jgi:excisionase family DNA binding protein
MAKAQTSPDDLLTTIQAGAELGIKRNRVMELVREGRLPATKFGNAWMIRRADLDLVRDRPTGVHLTDWRAEKKQAKPDEKKSGAKKKRS